jgi:hypothetical protein
MNLKEDKWLIIEEHEDLIIKTINQSDLDFSTELLSDCKERLFSALDKYDSKKSSLGGFVCTVIKTYLKSRFLTCNRMGL